MYPPPHMTCILLLRAISVYSSETSMFLVTRVDVEACVEVVEVVEVVLGGGGAGVCAWVGW